MTTLVYLHINICRLLSPYLPLSLVVSLCLHVSILCRSLSLSNYLINALIIRRSLSFSVSLSIFHTLSLACGSFGSIVSYVPCSHSRDHGFASPSHSQAVLACRSRGVVRLRCSAGWNDGRCSWVFWKWNLRLRGCRYRKWDRLVSTLRLA